MSRWIGPFALLVLLLGGAFVYQSRQAANRAGFPAPDFTLPDLNGRTLRLSALQGNVIFLNLWTTWCPPCREEMPAMQLLHNRMRGKDFVMLAVSQDEKGRAAVEPFVREMGITFPVLIDPEARLSHLYGVTGYPETFVIDRNGQVIRHIVGPDRWDTEAAYRYFSDLVDAAAVSVADAQPNAPSDN
jgi:peroxiredoxin